MRMGFSDLVHVDPDAIVLHCIVEGLELVVPVTLHIHVLFIYTCTVCMYVFMEARNDVIIPGFLDLRNPENVSGQAKPDLGNSLR